MNIGRTVGASILLSSALAAAQAPPPSASPAEPTELRWQLGPKTIELGHDVQLQLPADDVFLGMPDADRVLRAQGSFNNANTLGIVLSREKPSWEVVIDYEDAGYVKDDETIDADALLKSFREGTAQENEERAKNGFPPVSIGDWTERPRYERQAHRLVWAVPASSTRGTTINYNTRVLGRHGYVSLDLLSAPERIGVEKANAATLLAATTFKNGARYEDFDQKHDKVAKYGLMGLILGGAGIAAVKVAKIGLLAGLLKFLVAGWKLVAAFFIALFAGIKRFFTGKPAQKETKLPPTGTDGNS